MFLRLWAFLTRRRLVWLRDHDGEITLSAAKRDPWGDLTAPRYFPFTDIRTCTLGDDGKVYGVCYVTDWKFYDEAQP